MKDSTKKKVLNSLRYFYMSFWNRFFTYLPSYTLRRVILKYFYRANLANCNIHMGVKFFSPWKLTVGAGSNIQGGCFLDCRGGITIGNNVDITLGVRVLTEDHDVRSISYRTRSRAVCFADGCVVGSFSLILPGVVMEKNSVLGAGSVLAKSISESTVFVGNPANSIGTRGSHFDYSCSYKRPFH